MANILNIFAKYPRTGEVKTRLAKDTSPEFAVETYTQFVRKILQKTQTVNAMVQIWVGQKDDCTAFDKLFQLNLASKAQSDGGLGTRMVASIETALKENASKIIIIGTDSPDLPQHIYQDAFDALDHKDCVIGPAIDGGYYLIGINAKATQKNWHRLFSGIEWSTEYVFQQTLNQAKEAKITIHLLPEWYDIDTIDDLKKLTNCEDDNDGK